jgi:hypothetical protein
VTGLWQCESSRLVIVGRGPPAAAAWCCWRCWRGWCLTVVVVVVVVVMGDDGGAGGTAGTCLECSAAAGYLWFSVHDVRVRTTRCITNRYPTTDDNNRLTRARLSAFSQSAYSPFFHAAKPVLFAMFRLADLFFDFDAAGVCLSLVSPMRTAGNCSVAALSFDSVGVGPVSRIG